MQCDICRKEKAEKYLICQDCINEKDQEIKQLNIDLEYQKKITADKVIEGDKYVDFLNNEIEKLKNENKQLKEQLQEQIDYKDEYYHYWQETKKKQRNNKQIRKQVFNDIKKYIKKKQGKEILYIDAERLLLLLDKIEKEDKQ